ncbi:hypothetical protein ADUPG1_012176 [Aduncisulcus paluster]|uniref:Uncharacterized protein n=1 Tax=Aduncisulcus paluster TaxID=2918883 RepID=A0ABQ5JYL7_9EUKA|nr:hypothetical protein ADUPG1_012176 [Aduncisulcus paluster]
MVITIEQAKTEKIFFIIFAIIQYCVIVCITPNPVGVFILLPLLFFSGEGGHLSFIITLVLTIGSALCHFYFELPLFINFIKVKPEPSYSLWQEIAVIVVIHFLLIYILSQLLVLHRQHLNCRNMMLRSFI